MSWWLTVFWILQGELGYFCHSVHCHVLFPCTFFISLALQERVGNYSLSHWVQRDAQFFSHCNLDAERLADRCLWNSLCESCCCWHTNILQDSWAVAAAWKHYQAFSMNQWGFSLKFLMLQGPFILVTVLDIFWPEKMAQGCIILF